MDFNFSLVPSSVRFFPFLLPVKQKAKLHIYRIALYCQGIFSSSIKQMLEEGDENFEVGEASYNSPIKMVPARKILGIGNGISQRYGKSNYDSSNFEIIQRNSCDNLDFIPGKSALTGIGVNNFSLSYPTTTGGRSPNSRLDPWRNGSTSELSTGRTHSAGNYDNVTTQSGDQIGAEISFPFQHHPTESAFRLIDSNIIAAPSFMSASSFQNSFQKQNEVSHQNDKSKREFALTPGPPKKSAELDENSPWVDNSISTDSFNFLFATPAKLNNISPEKHSEDLSAMKNGSLADVCQTTMSNNSLSPDLMNIVNQILKAQTISREESFINSHDSIDTAKLNDELNKISKFDDNDLLATEPIDSLRADARVFSSWCNNEFKRESLEVFKGYCHTRDLPNEYSQLEKNHTVSTSYPPGLYESKQPDIFAYIADKTSQAPMGRKHTFDGHYVGDTMLQSDSRLGSLSTSDDFSNFNQSVRVAHNISAFAGQLQGSGSIEQKGYFSTNSSFSSSSSSASSSSDFTRDIYRHGHIASQSLPMSPTSAFRSQRANHNHSVGGTLSASVSSLSGSFSTHGGGEEEDRSFAISRSRYGSRDSAPSSSDSMTDMNRLFNQHFSLNHNHSSYLTNQAPTINAHNHPNGGQYGRNSGNGINAQFVNNQMLPSESNQQFQKQLLKKPIPTSIAIDYDTAFKSRDMSGPIPLPAHSSQYPTHSRGISQAQSTRNLQSIDYSSQSHSSHVIEFSHLPQESVPSTTALYHSNSNSNSNGSHLQSFPEQALAHPRHDKNFEPKIPNRSDRATAVNVPPINMYSLTNNTTTTASNSASNSNYPRSIYPLQSSFDSSSSQSSATVTVSKSQLHGNNTFSNRQGLDGQLRSSKDSLRDSKEATNGNSSTAIGSKSSSMGRQEFVESPRSKLAYKEFYKQFKMKEKDTSAGAAAAKAFAEESLRSMPENAVWRVYLELADLAKRSNLIQEVNIDYSEKIFSYVFLLFFIKGD